MSRLKPQRVRSSDIGAAKKILVEVTSYEIFTGVDRAGEQYEEDRVYFNHRSIPSFLRLNQKSLIFLANHGFRVDEASLQQRLPSTKLTFELVTGDGAYPYYVVTKIAEKAKSKRKDNSDDST